MLTRNILKSTSIKWKNYVIPIRVCSYHLSHIKNLKDGNKIEAVDEDKLLKELDSIIPSKVIRSLETNKEIINGSHIIHALKSLTKSYKKDIPEHSNNKISFTKEHYLKQICSIIDLNINKLTASEALQILDNFNRAGLVCLVNNHTQSLLKHIYDHLDDLSFIEYNLLSNIMRNMPGIKMVKVIAPQLTKKFLLKLSLDLEENNILHLENAFSFISHNLNSYELMSTFICKIQNYEDDISLKSSIMILESVCSMKQFPPVWLNLLHRVYNDITKNVNELSAVQINYVIYMITSKLKTKKLDKMYSADFLDKLIKVFISLDPGFENALSAVKCFTYMRHQNIELLNYTCASYFEKKILNEQNIEKELGKLLVLIDGLAMAKHKTIFWNEIQNFILRNDLVLEYNYHTLCLLTLNLFCMDCYPNHILKKIFDSECDLSNLPLYGLFCKVYQKLKSNPEYNGPMPLKSQIDSSMELHKVIMTNREQNSPLLCHLEEGLGGPTYVKSNLSSKLFHIIDYAVVFQKNEVPVPINVTTTLNGIRNEIEYIEDIDIPSECTVIAILFVPDFWFTRNSNVSIGRYQNSVDVLEAMSYKVVLVNRTSWTEVPDKLKTSFLMEKIKSRLNKIE